MCSSLLYFQLLSFMKKLCDSQTNEIYTANNNGKYQNTDLYYLHWKINARLLVPFLGKSDLYGCFKFHYCKMFQFICLLVKYFWVKFFFVWKWCGSTCVRLATRLVCDQILHKSPSGFVEFDHVTNPYLYPDRYIKMIPYFLNKTISIHCAVRTMFLLWFSVYCSNFIKWCIETLS
jgi:hypothetical protein